MPANQETMTTPRIKIIDSFPNPNTQKYNEDLWYQQHGNQVVIINCQATDIRYPEHWSPLSIKCAFGGREYYHFGNTSLAVNDDNFLVVNEGALYSSSIESKTPIESFTLNFTSDNIREVFASINGGNTGQLDNPFQACASSVQFIEKLYPHNEYLSSIIFKIRQLVKDNEKNEQLYVELLYAALENMMVVHRQTDSEIDNIKAVRRSTKEELYKRLNLARDYMDSCFSEDISLHHLSAICFLNPNYLLRQFKKNFNITPHQYLMNRRMREAESILVKSETGISQLAEMVGFSDLSAFSKLFKRYTGLSPEHYRKKSGCTDTTASRLRGNKNSRLQCCFPKIT